MKRALTLEKDPTANQGDLPEKLDINVARNMFSIVLGSLSGNSKVGEQVEISFEMWAFRS